MTDEDARRSTDRGALFEPREGASVIDPADRKRLNRKRLPSIEGMEGRLLMSATTGSDVVMVSATTTDSKGVTVTYDVDDAAANQPIKFQVVRSADTKFDSSDVSVGAAQVVPPAAGQPAGQGGGTVDNNGLAATAPGRHTVTLALPDGLPPNPERPYVVVAAQTPAEQAAGQAPSTASFRKHVVAVITHGGKQPKDWAQKGPPWERRMAAQLLAEGYDAVIPYNWVALSGKAGMAARQAPRVAADVIRAASQFPDNEPVDVHFIGHSEGAVVNSEAILRLNADGWPANAKAGYLKVTMLDPHAANNAFPGKQYSVAGGLLGTIARSQINAYQSKAKDPLPVVTDNVQDAEVFYQRTPVDQTFGSNGGVYNLWGQVPVKGHAHYYDLTAPGISHAGKFGVQDWYRLNVVPKLGDGGTFVTTAALTGSQVGGETASRNGRREEVSYSGTAAPNTVVHLYAGAPGQSTVTPVGRTTTRADGTWDLTTRPIAPGRYRMVATTSVPRTRGERAAYFHPTAWLGILTVSPGRPVD